MTATAWKETDISAEEYARGEEVSSVKHEWFNGEVFAMAGGSNAHAVLCLNAGATLRDALRGQPCRAVGSDQRVKIEATGLQTYPDAMVYCPPTRFEGNNDQVLLNPCLIIEVLSPSTEQYDRTTKFAHYQQIAELSDYLLITQTQILVEHFARQDSSSWLLRTYRARQDCVELSHLGVTLAVAELYDGIDVPEGLQFGPIPREE